MTDLDGADAKVQAWLEALTGDDGPCGADLEYDNDFLALNQAAAGKPETQFEPAEPPNWRAVLSQAEDLFERTRDLRVAVLWGRGLLHVHGYAALIPAFKLLHGLLYGYADSVHPLPDPDDGDPYARVNALSVLAAPEGMLGDLRAVRVVADRAVGEFTGRMAELALGLSPARSDETDPGRTVLQQMLAAAVERDPSLQPVGDQVHEAVTELMAVVDERLGDHAPDLKPLLALVKGIQGLFPSPADAEAAEADADGEPDSGSGATATSRKGLSGSVQTRDEAIRAIDMICAYLERAEPSNPAPLFLRRARQLINHNFLQLMKELAPDSLAEVARIVGVDPDTVEPPAGS